MGRWCFHSVCTFLNCSIQQSYLCRLFVITFYLVFCNMPHVFYSTVALFLCNMVFSLSDRSKGCTLRPVGRPVHSDTNSASLGRIQPRCNHCADTIHSHISTAVCSHALIYTAKWTGAWWRERNCPSNVEQDIQAAQVLLCCGKTTTWPPTGI